MEYYLRSPQKSLHGFRGMVLWWQSYARYINRNSKIERILKKREERQQKGSSNTSNQFDYELPECLIFEILSWLPVKLLLQFKIVCKSWCSMIQSRGFISKHLKHKYSNNNDEHRRDSLIYVFSQDGELKTYELLLNEMHNKVIASVPLHGNQPYNYYICGPCDGLYYIWFDNTKDDRCLWNPTLKETKILPPIITKPNLPSNLTYFSQEISGFGFDSVTKDYKVVIIKGFKEETSTSDSELIMNIPPCVLVYSLRNNSWRYVTDLPKFYVLKNNKSYVFANTSLYWLASEDKDFKIYQVVIIFDLVTNKCREIKLPKGRTIMSSSSTFYGSDYECLMLYHGNMVFVTVNHVNKCFDVWALAKGSWAKKLTMGLVFVVQEPLGQWKDDLLIFQGEDGETLIICNLDTQETWVLKRIFFRRYFRCMSLCVYKESLVPLNACE